MATGVYTASETSLNLDSDTRVPRDVSDKMFSLEADITPLATLLMAPGLKQGASTAPKIEWLTTGLLPRLTTSTEIMDTTETGQDVATGTGVYFRSGDVVLNVNNSERMFVVSVSGDTLTVKRGLGTGTYGTSGTAGASGDILMRLGNASAEMAGLGEIRQVKYVNNFNYSQIFRIAGSFSRTAMKTKVYGEQEPGAEKKRKAIEHKKEINDALFWGGRQIDSSTRMLGGLAYYISSNVTSNVGTLTETIFNDWLTDVGRYGSSKKVLFVAPLIWNIINGFVRGKLAINDSGAGVKQYGVAISSYTSPQGKQFGIVPCADWADFTPTASTSSPGGTAFAVDMDNIQVKWLNGEKTVLLEDRQANDVDGKTFEYLSDLSLEVGNEQFHGKLEGVIA